MSNAASLNTFLLQLRLAQFRQNWQLQEEMALAQGWPPSKYLSCLCDLELSSRESARIKRNLKDAKLPTNKTIANFSLDQCEGLNFSQINQLCQSTEWIEEGQNVLLFGASGLGKTHLAAAIAHGAVHLGIRARFFTATALVQHLQAAKKALQINEALLKLDRFKLLIIDDLGYVKRDSAETSVLFELIAHRYERASLIVTANQPFSQWDSVFTDKTMTVAAVDRLVHHAYIFELEGDSYRQKKAVEKKETLKTN